MGLTEIEQRYLATQSYGRLATIAPNGHPQNKPVGFLYNAELGTIDIAGFDMGASRKFRNIHANPEVAFVVDDVVSEGPSGVRFLEIRGTAEALTDIAPPSEHLSPQVIRIHPRRVVGWNIDPDHPGLGTRDVTAGAVQGQP
jgi:pyridoxamine 5'-phosphate oxidase family protein